MDKLKELETKTEEELHNITILAYQVITKSSLFVFLDLLTDNYDATYEFDSRPQNTINLSPALKELAINAKSYFKSLQSK